MSYKNKMVLKLLKLRIKRFYRSCLMPDLMLLFLIVFPILINGQEFHFDFVNLTKDDGLTNDSYNSFVFKDSRGYIWISSIDGVNRYNGIEIENFKPDPDKAGSIKGKNVQSNFFEDKKGNIWFSTYQALNCYDVKQQQFKTYQLENEDQKIIAQDYHVFHFENKRSLLWLKAGNNIFSFNVNTHVYDKIPFETRGVRFTVDTLSSGEVNLILGCLWQKKHGVELFRFENNNWTNQKNVLALDPKLKKLKISQAIFDDKENVIWLISETGLIALNRKDFNQVKLYNPFKESTLKYKNGVFIAEHQLLLSTENSGLYLFNTKTKKITKKWTVEGEGLNKITSLSARELYLMEGNILWVSNKYKGVSFTKITKEAFKNPLGNILDNPTSVHFIVEDKKGQIWVSTSSKEIYVFDTNGNVLNSFLYSSTEPNNLDVEKFIGLEKDNEGNVWALGENVLYRYEEGRGWRELIKKNGLGVLSMFQTNLDKILISTYGGVKELIEEDAGFKLVASNGFEKDAGFGFYYLYQNEDNRLYVPFNSSELWVGEENDTLISFSKKIPIDADVYGFDFFNNKTIIGTSHGLAGLDVKDDFSFFNNLEKNGGINLAYRPIVDDRSNVWFGNNKGLGVYNLNNNASFLFKEENGLSGESFNPYAAIKTLDGQIWMGNREGLVVFHPDSIFLDSCVPKLQITEFLINNKPFIVDDQSEIKLDYDENNLAIKFVGIDCFKSDEVKILYKIDESRNASFIKNNNEVLMLDNLSPKTYHLEIVALNGNKVKSLVKKIKIIIEPPFWQKLWFQILAFLTIILIAYGIIQLYVHKKMRIQKIELARITTQQKERNRIADELHDDLGAGLSIIRFLTEELLSETIPPVAHKKLKKVSQSSKELLVNMREIIWALDTSNNTLGYLYKQIRTYASEYLSLNKKEYRINIDEGIEETTIGGERRRNIFLIIKESLHNIIKHADATKVEIDLLIRKKQLVIKIKDNGKGISKKDILDAGRGLKSMRKRAEAIDASIEVLSKTDEGTLVVLKLFEKNYY